MLAMRRVASGENLSLLLTTLATLVSSPASAQGTLASSAATVDWFARVTSLIAILIGVGGLVLNLLTRLDKAREREPAIDFDLTKTSRMGDYDFELKVLNRGDVSIQIVSLQCKHGVLEPDDAEIEEGGSRANYNGLRIERGTEETLVGTYKCEYGFAGPEEFVVTVRINDRSQQLRERRLVRRIP
jgi:hypothetical protein